jgi:hypothetical protein
LDAFAGSVFEEVWKKCTPDLILFNCTYLYDVVTIFTAANPVLHTVELYFRCDLRMSSYQLVPVCFVNIDCIMKCHSILVAPQSKVQVCSCLHAGIAGLNPTRGMDVCLLGVFFFFVGAEPGLCSPDALRSVGLLCTA